MIYLFGIFLILHGIVFFLYAGQSLRLFELKPGMTWPDNSLLCSNLCNEKVLRVITALLCALFGTTFIFAAIILIFEIPLWFNAVIYSSISSTLVYIIMWDGKTANIKDQGGIGITLNFFLIILLIFFF